MLLADSHFKPIIGIDFHLPMTPPLPSPIPLPYIGIVVDIADYIPKIGGTVEVNNIKRGCGFTGGKFLTMM